MSSQETVCWEPECDLGLPITGQVNYDLDFSSSAVSDEQGDGHRPTNGPKAQRSLLFLQRGSHNPSFLWVV